MVTAVIDSGAPNTTPVHTRDQIVNELAAVSLALLDKREERTKANKRFNADIKDLEKRQRELAQTVKSSGMRESIQMNFGSFSKPAAAPQAEPDEETDVDDEDN